MHQCHNYVMPTTTCHYRRVLNYVTEKDSQFYQRANIVDKTSFINDAMSSFICEKKKSTIDKKKFYLSFMHNNDLVGYSCLKEIQYNHHAEMHGHIILPVLRQKGLGKIFFFQSIQFFFEKFQLKKIILEPAENNISVNKLFHSVNAKYIKTYQKTIPATGFVETVNQYEFSKEMLNDNAISILI